MSANGYLIDRLTRRQILIQRLASGQVRESLPILRQMARDIRAALQRQDLSEFQTARLAALQLDIQAITSGAGVSLRDLMTVNMVQFAEYEAQFTQRLLQGAVTVELAGVSTAALGEAVTRAPLTLVSGQNTIRTTFAGVFDTFAAGAAREVMTTVQAGITAGATNAEITSNVMAMVNSRTRAQAETVVRTAANAAGTAARNEVYKANQDVLEGEEMAAVLDARTTLVCMGEDGKVYAVGVGPMPPLHHGCRTIRVPRIKIQFASLREGATRASMDGPVSSQRTYSGWLKDQPKSFQDEVLGPERAALFRSGQIPLDRFTDEAGRTLTLEQLRTREGITLE